MMKIAIVTLIIALLALVGAAAFVQTGVFNVSAAYHEPEPVRWLFDQVREYSIKTRSEAIVAPDLSGREEILSGASAYAEMCSSCHAAPGREAFVGAQGMNPTPPDLAEVAVIRTPGELFWAIENGIRMTGMPAWGTTHSDEEIWQLVAFLERLPGMTAADYDRLLNEAGESGHAHEHAQGDTDHHAVEEAHHESDGHAH